MTEVHEAAPRVPLRVLRLKVVFMSRQSCEQRIPASFEVVTLKNLLLKSPENCAMVHRNLGADVTLENIMLVTKGRALLNAQRLADAGIGDGDSLYCFRRRLQKARPPRTSSAEDHADKSSWDADPEKRRSFAEALRARGWEIREVGGDGNCMFRSIADQMFSVEEQHHHCREQCMEYMSANKAAFEPSIAGEAFEEYVARKRRDRVLGNHLELQCFADIYQRTVEVYRADNPRAEPDNVITPADRTGEHAGETPIRLSYHGELHYNSIRFPHMPGDRSADPHLVAFRERLRVALLGDDPDALTTARVEAEHSRYAGMLQEAIAELQAREDALRVGLLVREAETVLARESVDELVATRLRLAGDRYAAAPEVTAQISALEQKEELLRACAASAADMALEGGAGAGAPYSEVQMDEDVRDLQAFTGCSSASARQSLLDFHATDSTAGREEVKQSALNSLMDDKFAAGASFGATAFGTGGDGEGFGGGGFGGGGFGGAAESEDALLQQALLESMNTT